ncbi:hypothetical protein Fcan01_22834 [Folsomia candida]|uniref:Uncharacterized protein n=1 Tax=Folsomia candida TaxID=158441 RepID=A0A226DBY4_FOLCA|nr:hypothetical protein Fcan01_22834 [Folsomia candida]
MKNLQNFLSLFAILISPLDSHGFLNKPIFDLRTLQFISDFHDLDQTPAAIFSSIISTNPYAPRFLDNLRNWDTTNSRYNLLRIKNSSPNLKISRFRPRLGHTDLITFLLTPTIRHDGSVQKHEVYTRSVILDKIFHSIIFANENPTYIFIHLDYQIVRMISHFPSDTTITSHIIIFGSGYPVLAMCHPCKSRLAVIHRISKLSDISTFWKQLNTQDLRNAIVSETDKITGLDVPLPITENCIANFGGVKYPGEMCAEAVILEKFNFSKEVYKSDVAGDGTFSRHVIIASTPVYKTLADKRFNEFRIISRSLVKMVWYNYAINYIPFIFVVLVPKREMSFETLVMPFDTWTWRLNAAILIGVVIATTGFNSAPGDHYLTIHTTLWNQLFRSISMILGQTDSGKMSRAASVLTFTGVWYLAVFLMGNFYQGALYSCMTSIGIPSVPKELSDLLDQTDFDVVTMSHVNANLYGLEAIESTLSAAMIPDLL